MKQVFVDTSGWCALADKADKDHARALQFRDEIVRKCELVTSNYILDELYTLLLMNIGFQPTLIFVCVTQRTKEATSSRKVQSTSPARVLLFPCCRVTAKWKLWKTWGIEVDGDGCEVLIYPKSKP